jgi:hypothetical protein
MFLASSLLLFSRFLLLPFIFVPVISLSFIYLLGLLLWTSSWEQSQYHFVYETLVEYTRGIDSRFPVSCLAEKIKERGIKDKKTKKNAYQMEYMVRRMREGTGARKGVVSTISEILMAEEEDGEEESRQPLQGPDILMYRLSLTPPNTNRYRRFSLLRFISGLPDDIKSYFLSLIFLASKMKCF